MTWLIILGFIKKHIGTVLAVGFALALFTGAFVAWNTARDDHEKVGTLTTQLETANKSIGTLQSQNDQQNKAIDQLVDDQIATAKIITDLNASKRQIVIDSNKRIQQVEQEADGSADPAIRCAITGVCNPRK